MKRTDYMPMLTLAIVGISSQWLCAAESATVAGDSSATDYTVAIYYWPNFHGDAYHESHKGKGWTEWEIVKSGRPKFEGHYQPKVPLWGYRDESDPREMARSIDAMADAGIGAIIFDWYRYDDDIHGGVMIERALQQGFLQAANRNRIKFALMWANHTYIDCHPFAPGVSFHNAPVWRQGEVGPAAFKRHTQDAIDSYFRQPNYWKIDGRPYFSIYDLQKLTEGLGGLAGTRKALDDFRERVRAAGFPDLHLNVVDQMSIDTALNLVRGQPYPDDETRQVESAADLLAALRVDSSTMYTWTHHLYPLLLTSSGQPGAKPAGDSSGQPLGLVGDKVASPASESAPATDRNAQKPEGILARAAQAGVIAADYAAYGQQAMQLFDQRRAALGVTYFPHVSMGWDGTPRNYSMGMVLNNTPARFGDFLQQTRKWLDRHPESRGIVTLNSWNEWVEGSYIEPDTVHGLAYLEAVQAAFSAAPSPTAAGPPAAASDPRSHAVLAPGTKLGEKAKVHRFEKLRAGAIKTAQGWSVQDFASSFFNPNAVEITVTMTLVSDDPKFVFANGQVGTYTKNYRFAAMQGGTDNIYIGSPTFGKPEWPVAPHTNFTGSMELVGTQPFYYYFLRETEVGEAADPTDAYFAAWKTWVDDVPAAWDEDLQQFVIPYTNYWHNETSWPIGWHSVLTLQNNAAQPVTYTLTHIPYYGAQFNPKNGEITPYKVQEVQVVVPGGEEKQATLQELFGWATDQMSSMEGCLLISPLQLDAAKASTTVRFSVPPNSSGERLHDAIANPPAPAGTESAAGIRYSHEKSTSFRLEKMRSGAIKTDEGWNVQDFATSLFNPNSEKITVTWKMISDDPNFVFANGQVGTYTKVYHFEPLSGQTDNVYICPSFEAAKPDWPVSSQTNFTGTVEFTGSQPFYLYVLPPTGIGTSPDLAQAYFAAWGSTPGDRYYQDGGLRGVWDRDLRQFVIPYTIYWQNEKAWWPAAVSSTVTIENTTDQPVTYTVTHIPYYGGTYNPKTNEVIRFQKESAQLVLQKAEKKQLPLPELFGWPTDQMYSFEGCLLIAADSAVAGNAGTTAQLSISAGKSTEPLHEAFR
jgi:hypothetical protein